MGPTGRLVTIKRSGVDGPHFPLSLSTCLFGRGIECDIRIQLPVVSKQHCKIEINEQAAILFNFSSTSPTQVNGSAIDEPIRLKHGDVITIVDRSFRYENESHQNGSESTEFTGQRCEQGSLRRVSRSSLSSEPDGKVQDSNARSKLTEENVSGRSLVPVKNVKTPGTVSDDSEDHVARKTPNVTHSSELPGDNCRNVMDPTPGDFKEDSSVTLVSYNGELKSFPSTQCLRNSEKNESPFRKLYESMKEELDVKSEKENILWNRRKSRSQSHCSSENESAAGLQGGSQLLVSLKSRRKSGQSTQIKADPASGEQGSSQTEEKRTDEEPAQNPKVTMSPSILRTQTAETKTLVQQSQRSSSQKRQSEALSDIQGSDPVNLRLSEGFRVDNKTLTPRKSLTRNQTPTKVENAGNLGNTPEKLFSKKRRSMPTNVDVLTTETEIQNQTILAPLLVQVERKIQNDALNKPEKLDSTAGQMCSGSPDLSSVDVSNFGDSTNKIEGMSLKRRRVSFGGHLRPELFDENLPPNTPLKRGETPMKRRSLVTHTPTVLKKIIKEQSQPSRKEDSPSETHLEVTAQNVFMSSPAQNPTKTPLANDQRRRSSKASSVSSDSKSPHQTDTPKKGGRRSGNLPSKRTSIDRSQHELLQMIYSKRRSGASEANLIVAKSWADVVKLGAKQTQTKVVKHGPQRQLNKRQRRINTPKKPTGSVHNQFSTGHANSPCTIVIGKAHIEKVNMPARPYRMLNNFVFNKKMDFNEDLSGLTEMFKTPAKEKPQMMRICPITFSDSEDLLGKKFQVPNSEEKPLLCTSENFGESVFPSAQKAAKEPSDKSSASPALKQQDRRINEDIVKTPRNIYKMTSAEMNTPVSEAEPPKVAASTNKSRRSVELRNKQTPGAEDENEERKTDTMENILGRRLRKTPLREQKLKGEMKESERSFEICKNIIESKENSEKIMAVRRSRRSSELKWEPTADLTALKRWQGTEPKEDLADIPSLLQTPDYVAKPVDTENKTTKLHCKSPKPEPVNMPTRTNVQLKTPPQKVDVEELLVLKKPTQKPGETTHTHREPVDDEKSIKLFKETVRRELDSAENVTGSKGQPRTPKEKTQPLEDLAGFRELFQTPDHAKEPMTDDKTATILSQSPQPEPAIMSTSKTRRLKTPLRKVNVEDELSALRKPTRTPGEIMLSHQELVGGDKDIAVSQEAPEQKLDPADNVTGSKRRTRTPKKKLHSLEDLVGFKELFQTPDYTKEPMTDDRTTEPVNTPTSRKRGLETPLQKVDIKNELSALRKPTQTPRETMLSHKELVGGDKDIAVSQEAPEQKLDPADNVTGSKRWTRTPKKKIHSLEDLVGFKELFQTPDHTKEPMTDDTTIQISCRSPQAEPVNTPTSRKRGLKTPQRKVDLENELSALRKPTQTPGENTFSHKEPVGGDKDIAVSQEAPEQKLDPADNVTRSKRQTRTPKKKLHSLEDLVGFKELFQTPDHANEPMTDDTTTQISCRSPQAEPVNTPTSRKRGLKTPPQRVDVEEELSVPTQTPEKTMLSHKEPVGGDKDIAISEEAPKQKLDPVDNVTAGNRRTRTPKEKTQPLEDLAGFRELFQTPDHAKEPMTDDKTATILSQSPQPELVIMSTSKTRRLKTLLQKVDVEDELSALRKPTQTLGENTFSHKEQVGGDKHIAVSQEAPEQKLDPADNVTRSKRQTRTPKKKLHSLEDLVGFKELFQTPDHANEPMTDDTTTQISCRSPQAEPVNTPTSRKRGLKTSPQRVDVEEELSVPTQTPEKTVLSHKEPVGGDRSVAVSQEAPEQKLDPAENVTGSKRQTRTPKKKLHSLEDLVGFKELFQTPHYAKEPMTDDRTTQISCKSPQAEPVNTPTSRKRGLKTPLQKMDVEDELSAIKKPTQTPEETTLAHKELVGSLVGGDRNIAVSQEGPEQTLDPADNVAGSKRRMRTPKKKIHSLEDLVGFKELFQTPDHAKEPMTDDKTTQISCRSPQAEPVNTRASRWRWLKTPPHKVDIEDELSARRKPTQTPNETVHTQREPVDGDKDIKLFKETSEQKLDSKENVTRSKRQPRRPKEKAQPLEDLDGLKMLFQTPDRIKEPMTDDKTTKISCKSPQAEPANTPTSSKRLLRAPPWKVEEREGLSAGKKPTQTLGEMACSHGEPVDSDKDIKAFKHTARQELDPAENVTGNKRQLRIPKEKSQPLEDVVGFKELFQSPVQAKEPTAITKTTKMPCKSPQPEPVVTPTNMRQLKTSLGKVGVEDVLSTRRKPTRTLGKAVHAHREPVDDKDIKLFKEAPKQKLDSEENVTGSKRRPRRLKEKAQPLEDLDGLKMLFRTPDHSEEPTTDEKTSKIPCKAPQTEPVKTPANRKRLLRALPRKKEEQEDLSAHRKPTRTLRERIHSRREPVSGDKDITVFKGTARQAQDPAANVTGNKRQPRTKEKAQLLEDPAGLKELFQTPAHTHEPMTDEKTTKMPCKSSQVEPVNTNMPTGTKRQLRVPPRKVDIEDERSACRKPTETPGETTHTHGEPVVDDKDIKLFKETPKQELDPEENVTRSKKQPRICKKKARPLEDLDGLKELIQTPDHTDDPVTDEKTTKMPCESPCVEPVTEPPSKKRRLRAPPQKVDEQEDLSAPRKPTQTLGKTMRSRREPVGDDKDITVFKETAKEELDPAANVTGNRRWPRRTKEKAQPLEDLTRYKEPLQTPAHAKELGSEAESVKMTPTQTADKRKPVKISRRVLRAPKIEPTDDLAGTRDPVQSQGESSVSPSPKRKRGKDGRITGTKRLRSVPPPPDTAEEKPLQKKQRMAPRETCEPPEPTVTEKKSRRMLAKRIEPVKGLPSNNGKTEKRGQTVEDAAAPNKGMSLRSRRPNKTNVEEQKSEFPVSAEKIKTKRNEKKPMNTSQEMKLQNSEDGAENSTSGGQVPGSRTGLRSGRRNKMPLPNVAEEKARKKSVEISVKSQKESKVTEHSDSKSLRSRKITVPSKGNISEGESEQRVTRGAKKRAETTTKAGQ
ncbi:proliferation marker protein Ki-67 isoform X1 [Diceros bicornis minor]|uniref:proliferation marker protein Ki-67 isoform X1 n=1 Tax=Diceros bicornis minor TaxID=77932 RepID=UPI0026EC1201|nr:proliferation marker protein Ki-67 isoform X1 [Diceros bicornis minor]XP_058400270.1 proliferation marker protein Ki-67 isoform X1 [Diceros bicornis minor]